MLLCRLAIVIGFDFSMFELNINVQERKISCRSFTSELNSNNNNNNNNLFTYSDYIKGLSRK